MPPWAICRRKKVRILSRARIYLVLVMKHSLFPRAMKKEIVTFATMAIGILATCAVAQQTTDSTSPASSGATTVNDLAADPSAYLGQVAVVGVVAAVKAGQGFTIVDKREYAACGLSCFNEPDTRKIPVRWDGAPPKP